MELLITGASGFLGRYVVAQALRRGHAVRALVRPGRTQPLPWAAHPHLRVVEQDIERPEGLDQSLAGGDALIHLALAHTLRPGQAEQTADTLLKTMATAGVGRFVAMSSFAVYDYQRLRPGQVLDESSPLETRPTIREAYTRGKLHLEQAVRERSSRDGWSWIILRPGAIYGPNRLWTARLGQPLSRSLWLRIGRDALVPLSYVENCAEAIVRAAAAVEVSGQALNIVDDDLPTQAQYVRRIRGQLQPRPAVIALPRGGVRLAAVAATWMNDTLLRGRAPLPGLLAVPRFDARFKPLRFSNQRIKAALGWQPRYGLDEALARCERPESQLLTI